MVRYQPKVESIKGTGGGSRVKNISLAYFIEFFLTNSTLFASSKNSKYFPSNRVGRAAKIVIFGPKNGLKLIKINQNRACLEIDEKL